MGGDSIYLKNSNGKFQNNMMAKFTILSMLILITLYLGSYINNSRQYLRNEIIIAMTLLMVLFWYVLKGNQVKKKSNKIIIRLINLSLIIIMALSYMIINETIAFGNFIYDIKSLWAIHKIIDILQAVIIISILLIAVKSTATKINYFGTIMHFIGVYFTFVGYKNLSHACWLPLFSLPDNPLSKNILIYMVAILLIILYFVYEKIRGGEYKVKKEKL